MKFKIIPTFLLFIGITSYTSAQTGTFKDKRDSTEYKTVVINGLTWTAENIKFEMKSNIAEINQINDTLIKNKEVEEVGYYYSIVDLQKAVPEGWRIPTKKDLEKLFENHSDNPTSMFASADALPYLVTEDKGTNATGFSASIYGSFSIYNMKKKNEQIRRAQNKDANSYDAFSTAMDNAEKTEYDVISKNDHGWYFKDEYGDVKSFSISNNKLKINMNANNAYFLRLVKIEN